MSNSKTIDSPQIELMAICIDCKQRHHILTNPGTNFMREMDEWENKHRGHNFEFVSPRRNIPSNLDDSLFEEVGIGPWWLDYKENANIKLAFASSSALTYTSVNSLASDTNLLAGASSLAVDNTSNLYLDYMLSALVKNNTTTPPTVSKEIDIYLYNAFDDSPTYPDTMLGTDATKTVTTVNILNSAFVNIASLTIAATTSQVNVMRGTSVSGAFGGFLPSLWAVFTVHNSGQSLAASGNTFSIKPVYATSI